MAVASCASSGQTHPDGRNGFRAIAGVEHCVLLIDDAAFVRRHVATIEARGNLLIERCEGQQVAGKIFDRKLIIGHVLVERFDHPVTVSPHFTIVIEVNSVSVRVASIVQPIASAVFAPSW